MGIRALSLVLLSLAGALPSRDEGGAARTNRLEFEFEFAGCARVRPGPVCELGDQRELTLWVPGSEKPQIGGAARVREARFLEAGWQMKLAVPAGARELRVRAGERRGRLRVAESSEPEPLRELARLWKDGQWEQVRASLDTAATRLQGPERERLRAYRARLAMRDGEVARAATELEHTASSAAKSGLLLEASHDRFAVAYLQTVRLGDYGRARAELDAAERDFDEAPEIRVRLAYNRGILAKATGDARGALVEFRAASVLSRRLGLLYDELAARQELALALNRLYRHAEALKEQEAIVAEDAEVPSCLLSSRWEKLAWILLSHSEPALLRRAETALDRAEQLAVHCPDPWGRRNQQLNRVALALLRGDAADAGARLQALDANATGRSTALSAWQALYSGRLHLLRGAGAEALAAFEQARALAGSVQLEDCGYLAELDRARVLAQQSAPDTIAAYFQAEDAADALVRSAPFGQGQQLTALQVQESSRELLSLLVERDRIPEAYALAGSVARRGWASNFRASRIAALKGAEKQRWDRAVSEYQRRRRDLERAAREDWKLSTEGLSATRLSRALEIQRMQGALGEAYAQLSREPARAQVPRATDDAELTLAAGRKGWWAFLRRGEELEVEPLRDLDRDLVRALERFARKQLLHAALLRVHLPPDLAALDVHALEVFGSPLVERVPVAYSLAPGDAREPLSGANPAAAAIFLGDPNQDLTWAGSEAKRLSSRLVSSRAWFGERVTFETVRAVLPGAALLHFAGHASSGGLDGLDGALELSGGQRLSFGDVFSLQGVPEFVVLSACSSTVSPGSGGGLSIGQAFVAAGARLVIGSSRTVSDSVAQNFMQALYDALASDSGGKLPRDTHVWASAVRVASMKVKRADPSADWASMRLLLP